MSWDLKIWLVTGGQVDYYLEQRKEIGYWHDFVEETLLTKKYYTLSQNILCKVLTARTQWNKDDISKLAVWTVEGEGFFAQKLTAAEITVNNILIDIDHIREELQEHCMDDEIITCVRKWLEEKNTSQYNSSKMTLKLQNLCNKLNQELVELNLILAQAKQEGFNITRHIDKNHMNRLSFVTGSTAAGAAAGAAFGAACVLCPPFGAAALGVGVVAHAGAATVIAVSAALSGGIAAYVAA